MIDEREIVRVAVERLAPPEPAYERLVERRDRKRRNQRIAAGVVGIAVFVAAVWVLGTKVGQDTTAPADRPTLENPAGKTAEDVARDFLYETAFFETDLAVRHLVNASLVPSDAAVSGLGLDGIEQFRRWLSYNEATGFEIIPTSCEETGRSSRGTYVRCTFDFHGIRSEAIGRGPYSGSYLDLLVARPIVEYGRILDVSAHMEIEEFGPQMWDPFDEWVSSNYPADAAVMYNSDHTDYRLSNESIRLWEQHTREYVDTGPAESGPAETGPATGEPDVVGIGSCSDGARSRLVLTLNQGVRLEVSVEIHRSPSGDAWRISMRRNGTLFFRRTKTANDSGDVEAHSPWFQGQDGRFRARAIDRSTGEVCWAHATI